MANSNRPERDRAPRPGGEEPPPRRVNPTIIALLAGLALVLILIALFARGGDSSQDRLSDDQLAAAGADDPEKRCADQDTYDMIKRELFRRAAQLRGSDQAAFDQLAANAVVRMESPVVTGEDEDLGTVSCEGTLSLDLPPGLAVVGGRRTLTADIGYTLQGAADASGDVVTISNADAILTPLATLARTQRVVDPQLPDGNLTQPAEPLAPLPGEPGSIEPAPPVAEPEPEPVARPSFNCGNARTRGEVAVCNDPSLASLDRQMASQFNRAMAAADSSERALLQQTRNRFLSFRDRCGSDSCIADAYRGRMREITDIMAGRWTPPR